MDPALGMVWATADQEIPIADSATAPVVAPRIHSPSKFVFVHNGRSYVLVEDRWVGEFPNFAKCQRWTDPGDFYLLQVHVITVHDARVLPGAERVGAEFLERFTFGVTVRADEASGDQRQANPRGVQ